VLALAVASIPSAGTSAAAAAFVVNSTGTATDPRPGDGVCATSTGVCTLRAAIHESNVLVGAQTVELPAGTYPSSTPPGSSNDIGKGDLDITDGMTINGAGAGSTVIDGRGVDRLLEVHPEAGDVTLPDLTLRGGSHPESGGGILATSGGGVTLARSLVLDNQATGAWRTPGDGSVTVDSSKVSGNYSASGGAGLANSGRGTLVVIGSTISGNLSDGDGGAIDNAGEGDLTVIATTLSGNVASGEGGAVNSAGKADARIASSAVSTTSRTTAAACTRAATAS
jgi:hypothetical protein